MYRLGMLWAWNPRYWKFRLRNMTRSERREWAVLGYDIVRAYYLGPALFVVEQRVDPEELE